MRVLLTGGTGAMGRPTVARLVEAGNEVRAIARNEEKAEQLRRLGADPLVADLFDPDAVEAAVPGVDAVLHMATNVPPLSKMALPGAWSTHNRLRTEATRLLLEAARKNNVRTFLKESITFTYPDRGEEWIDESVTPDDSVKMLRPTLDGEHQVARFGVDGGRGVILRFGLFYGPENRATDENLRMARLRMAPVPGDPKGYVSSIHMEDAATAVVAALEAPSGVYNVVDDEPITRREYADAFAAAFDLPRLRIPPARVIRAVGGSGARAVTASQRVSNERFKTTTGWVPAYSSAREGWAAIGLQRKGEAR